MPDYFSHAICAHKIYDKLERPVKNRIENFDLFLLGAQGGDVFFTYKLHFKRSNLGRKLHRIAPDELFEELAKKDLSYAAGFATHYALDCTLHPKIYAFERASKHPLAHMKFEADLGLYISRKYSSPRKILPRENVLACTFNLYDCIEGIEPSVTVTGVERCLKRHFSYTRALFTGKKQKYFFDYDFRSLSSAVDEAVELGAECVTAVVKGEIEGALFDRSFLEK